MKHRSTDRGLALVVTLLIVAALASCCLTSCAKSTAPARHLSADSLHVRFDTSPAGRVRIQ